MFGKKKGQATIEYLVLLAVAIIIALVIFAFMGWIPGFAGSLKERQVKLYWASQYPIQIRDYKYSSDGNLSLWVQNTADYKITITGLNTSVNSSTGNFPVLGGESKVISFSILPGCTTGSQYELSGVTFTYDVDGGLQNQKETGDRPLVGTCQ